MPPSQTRRNSLGSAVGLKDIAQACDLSEMSVSRALRGAKGVGEATRRRVQDVARQMGYIPNRGAAILASRTSSTKTAGIMLPVLGHTIFPEILDGIESELNTQDYRFFLCKTDDDPQKELRETIAMLERRVDGMIMAPASTRESQEAVRLIQRQNCPLVFMDRALEDMAVDAAVFDDYQGAFDATTHLIESGCRRIACLSGPETIWTVQERGRGFRNALDKAGVPYEDSDIIRTDLTHDGGETGMEELLDQPQQYDGVFCVAARVGIGALLTLQRRNIRIPQDMTFAGFTEVLEADLLRAPITTVVQDAQLLGRKAARMLLKRIGEQNAPADGPAEMLRLPTRLHVRSSEDAQ